MIQTEKCFVSFFSNKTNVKNGVAIKTCAFIEISAKIFIFLTTVAVSTCRMFILYGFCQ